MENNNLKRLVFPVTKYLVPILQETQAICVERHAVGRGKGADNYSFATDSWSFPARIFKDSAKEGLIPFEMSKEAGCVLFLNGKRIHHHRVGYSEADDIWESFPNNAEALSNEHLQIPLDFEDTSFSGDPDLVVLAYMANSTDGLCAVYLATIGRVDNNRIVEWAEVEEVWSRDSIDVMESISRYATPPEESPKPVVTRKARKVRSETTDE